MTQWRTSGWPVQRRVHAGARGAHSVPRLRSWVYGDGCFDMTRTFGHRLFKVKEHVDRLYRSLKYLRIDPGFGPAEDVRR